MLRSDEYRTFLISECRPGVRVAIETIRERLMAGASTTAIVAAPRYGKSNISRLTSIESIECGWASLCVVLSPWCILRDQLNDVNKIRKMQSVHKMDMARKRAQIVPGELTGGNISPDFHLDKPRRHWWSMTNAAACQEASLVILESIARSLVESGMPPMLVFIDESHCIKGESPEGWAKAASRLRDAGAHIVLLTGTPERSDNSIAFGFDVEKVDERAIVWTEVRKNKDYPDTADATKKSGSRVEYRLKPDVEISLEQAWGEGAILKIDTRRFKFKADGRCVTDIESRAEAAKALSRAVRDPGVIKEAVSLMLNELSVRRRRRADTAAMVFVGNDKGEDEKGQDFHAREVKRVVRDMWPTIIGGKPSVLIATMGDDGANKISRFVGDDDSGRSGVGDVLIVKQMGGVGLDAPRIKVAVDLSTIRTKSNATQRWLRVSTKWENETHGTLIIPDDYVTNKLHEDIIRNQGGQYVVENIVELSKSVKKIGGDGQDGPKKVEISDAERNGARGHTLDRVDSDTDLIVDAILSAAPALSLHTRWEIASMFRDGLLRLPETACLDRPVQPPIFDSITETKDRQTRINELTRNLANLRYKYTEGDVLHQNEQWIIEHNAWISRAKNAAGITCKLGKCLDVEKLGKALKYLEQAEQDYARHPGAGGLHQRMSEALSNV